MTAPTPPTARFAKRTAVLTGASRGIGFAVAERLVSEGARVVITARHEEGLARAVDALGGEEYAIGIAGRADDAEHRAAVVATAIERFGGIDMLVNNTGINTVYGPMIDLDLAAARKIVEVNCLATLGWAQEVYRGWMREHGGAIVNVSSVAGLRPAQGIGFYGASKAMLRHMTEQLAVELAPGIRVNAVAPAVVKTQFAEKLYESGEEALAAGYPMRRLGVPEDVASAVVYLLSDEASWTTGQTLVVDGGILLRGGV
ncbi:3-ketoacyl-ACP reductase [Microbacterium sp. Root61]|uniref:SDR family oxidoreductase n=1 Tax=Microbacterium sp. Root61 TaxID=1736570 RepID=UPI0006FEEDC4|nr:SDR family oxidoreductase [Microbacterium sp. Root61]KRA25402.1 3-ketoacyl-ACP reductase [Microbacterium sp. Root61]